MIENEIISKKYERACDCPITAAVNVIGGKWKPVIIWILMAESRRFGELHKSIPGIALKVLSRDLKELEADKLIIRVAKPVVPPHVEYSLTDFGLDLSPVLLAMKHWAAKYNV